MRTAGQANYALNRRPENRRIYAEQQIAWFYTDLLKAQHGFHYGLPYDGAYWQCRIGKAYRDLAEAHEQHAKICASLGPARVVTQRVDEVYEYELRDATGFISARDDGFPTRMKAAVAAHNAAYNLGLEVE